MFAWFQCFRIWKGYARIRDCELRAFSENHLKSYQEWNKAWKPCKSLSAQPTRVLQNTWGHFGSMLDKPSHGQFIQSTGRRAIPARSCLCVHASVKDIFCKLFMHCPHCTRATMTLTSRRAEYSWIFWVWLNFCQEYIEMLSVCCSVCA